METSCMTGLSASPLPALLAVALLLSACSRRGEAPASPPAQGRRSVASPASATFPTDDAGLLRQADEVSGRYRVRRGTYVVLVDYTRSIAQDRLYLVNRRTRRVVLRSKVSHAWASGLLCPVDFSNEAGSRKSSPGAFRTLGAYQGMWGYSMRIEGLDRGVNDRALSRAVVFHSTERMKGPYTWGCFATSAAVNRALIDSVKGGSLVYVHR
jgi:hypothetical protein